MNTEFGRYRPLIEAVATQHGLPPLLVAAVAQRESAFKADAFRHEPQFWVRYMKSSPQYHHLHPRRYASSYGLMQPMWVVAVEEGLDQARPPEVLFVPEESLEYGCRRLRKCLDWAKQFVGASEKEALLSGLAAYNGGRNAANKPPNPRNIAYALRVWQHMIELGKVA